MARPEEAGCAVRFTHEVIGLFSKETRCRIAVTPAELRVVWWAGAYFLFVLGGYRTGDVVGGGTRMLLRTLTAGLLPVVLVALPLTAVWAWLGIALGRGQAARIRRVPAGSSATMPASSDAGSAPETSA